MLCRAHCTEQTTALEDAMHLPVKNRAREHGTSLAYSNIEEGAGGPKHLLKQVARVVVGKLEAAAFVRSIPP